MATRFQETVNIRQVDSSSGGVGAALALSDRLESFKQQTLRTAQEQAAQRGLESAGETELTKADVGGQQVTQAPTKKETNIFGIGDIEIKAHNKSMQAAYLASLDSDNRNAVADIAANNAENIAGFNDAINGYRAGVLEGVDPSVRQAIQIDLDDRIESARGKIYRAGIKRDIQQNKETVNANAIEAADSAFRHARNGDQLEAGEELVKSFESIDALDLPADKKQIRKTEIRREFEENGLKHKLDTVIEKEGLDQAFAEVETMSEEVPKGWTPDEWERFIDGERADINRERSRQKAGRAEINSQAKQALKDYEAAVSLGFEVSPQETTRVSKLVAGDEGLNKRFNITQKVKSFSVRSASDRRKLLDTLETGELVDVQEYAAALKADSTINIEAQKDGLSLGIKQGLIESTPIEFGNVESIKARQQQADILSGHYGVDVSVLTDGEATDLASRLPKMTTPEKIQMAVTFQDSPGVWGQLSKKNAGAFAMAGASGDLVLMDSVFKGQELLDAGVVKAIRPADYLSDFHEVTGDIYNAEDQRDILKSAIAYYAQNAEDVSGVYDSGNFEDALEAVTGGVANINGFKLELPRGVDEDDFDDLISDIQPETIDALGGVNGMSSERAAQLIPHARIRSVGNSQYRVELDGGALFDKDGLPFIIEYTDELAASNKALDISKSRATRTASRSQRGD